MDRKLFPMLQTLSITQNEQKRTRKINFLFVPKKFFQGFAVEGFADFC